MLKVDGAQLFTLEIGDGPDVAVLLHGGPGASHDYLRPQMDAVAEPGRRRLFYYDQRGGGRSPLDAGVKPGGWPVHVADLEAVRTHLGRDQLTLVGYSWGALLAMLYAVEHPDRVEKLALISPAPAAMRERAAMKERMAQAMQRPAVEELRRTLDPKDRRAKFALAVSSYFADPRRALDLTPFVVKQGVEDAIWQSLRDYDLRARLRELDLPSLVVHGLEDVIPVETAQATADALNAELITLPRCGHVPYIEAPEPLFAALRRFLD
jgi:proline iminopeptidase